MVAGRSLSQRRFSSALRFDVWNYLGLAFLGFLTLYPFYYMVVASFSSGNALIAHQGLLLLPVDATLIAYERVASNPKIARGFLNSIYVVVAGVGINMAVTSLAAYALSRKHLAGRSLLLKFAVFTMVFDRGLIPLFLLVRNVGLYGSLWAVILTFAVNTYNLLIMVTFFRGVPESLEESAIVDGAGHMRILWSIFLPVSKAVVATLILFYAVGRWNGYFYAMIFLPNPDRWPVSLVLREIIISEQMNDYLGGVDVGDQGSVAETIKYATAVVTTLPILLLYPFLQRYFTKGVMLGSIKG